MPMFSEMIAAVRGNRMPDPVSLAKRFDFALTKKLGVVRLPPSFWTEDAKINPRSDHLFWAALLLGDRQRIDMVLSVMAVELAETTGMDTHALNHEVFANAVKLVAALLGEFPEAAMRNRFEGELHGLIPELMSPLTERRSNA